MKKYISYLFRFFRFIAKKVGLAGSTEEDFVHADMILEHCVDYLNGKTQIPNCY